jgi:hypothetical protein
MVLPVMVILQPLLWIIALAQVMAENLWIELQAKLLTNK